MRQYSLQPRDQIFVKGYRFLSFARNMGKNVDKNISKIWSRKYGQKRLNHAKQSASIALKTAFKRAIQKTAEGIGDLTWNKLIKLQESQKLCHEIIQKHEEEILREWFVPSELRHNIIDDLRLKKEDCLWSRIKDKKLLMI